MKILLIEDNQNLCMTIKSQLSKEGFLVDVCNTGEEAFLYAINPENDYDLAIVDRMLPVVDGLTIIKAMREKDIQIPVIIITGMSELNDKIEGLDNAAHFDHNTHRHYHLLCTECQQVFDIPADVLPMIDKNVAQKTGMMIESYDISFRGICPKCQNTNSKQEK